MNDRTQNHLLASHRCADQDTLTANIARTVGMLMTEHTMTRDDLEDATAIDMPTLNGCLDGVIPFTLDQMEAIAEAFDLKASALIERAHDTEHQATCSLQIDPGAPHTYITTLPDSDRDDPGQLATVSSIRHIEFQFDGLGNVSMSPGEARSFAAGIIAACDDLDAGKGEVR